MKKILLIILMVLLIGCTESAENEHDPVGESPVEEAYFDSVTIDDFYKELFVELMALNPEYIDDLGDLTAYGVPFQKDTLTMTDKNHEEALSLLLEEGLKFMNTMTIESDDAAYINYINVKWFLEMELESLKYIKHTFFLSHIIGEHRNMYSLLLEIHVIENEKDARDWISRVQASEEKINILINKYTTNLEAGYVMDAVSVDYAIGQLRTMTDYEVKYLELYTEYIRRVELLELDPSIEESLIRDAAVALEMHYMPGIDALKKVLIESKKTMGDPQGVWALPDGDAYYLHALKKHTTTDMTPEEIHNLGLSEVERISNEIRHALNSLGYEGELVDMINAVYTNAASFSGDAAMDEYKRVASLIEDDLDQFFLAVDIPATSPDIRVSPGGNFYVTPSIDGKRSGAYFLDLAGIHYDFSINTLAYHETVPGHHLEREHELLLDVPMIRKVAFNTAYIEGWALYAETLADEYGYNPTPEHRIGYLKSELHRAARLVVDTGIHYKRWTRQQAVDYLVDKGLLSKGYAQNEVTRYTSWPGQACAYKIGQLKFVEMRTYMSEVLGEDFDIKAYHHLVLGNGSMPLELLEDYVQDSVDLMQ